jgi:hypothetical protein
VRFVHKKWSWDTSRKKDHCMMHVIMVTIKLLWRKKRK